MYLSSLRVFLNSTCICHFYNAFVVSTMYLSSHIWYFSTLPRLCHLYQVFIFSTMYLSSLSCISKCICHLHRYIYSLYHVFVTSTMYLSSQSCIVIFTTYFPFHHHVFILSTLSSLTCMCHLLQVFVISTMYLLLSPYFCYYSYIDTYILLYIYYHHIFTISTRYLSFL